MFIQRIRVAHCFHQRILSRFYLLIASLLMIAPVQVWAIQKNIATLPRDNVLQDGFRGGAVDSPSVPHVSTAVASGKFADVIQAIKSYPDVVVFPIWVAGPVVASARRHRYIRLAEATMPINIAVIYPDIGKPYRSVFTQIIGGIEEKAPGHVTNIAVGPDVDVAKLSHSLLLNDTKVVIALGRQGVSVASRLDKRIGVVEGAVLRASLNDTRNHQVNTLSPDPALLFSRLKAMTPNIRRIFTVYDPRQNSWMMQLAKEAAHTQDLELVAYEATDLRSAMRAYQNIFKIADSKRDALWLLQDSTTVDEGTVLPFVLRESWEHNMAVFSSSFSHVRRGVLFSLYPNNVELGRHLANSALGFLASGEKEISGMLPLREVLMAINLRTARHLEINADHLKSFNMAFPEQ